MVIIKGEDATWNTFLEQRNWVGKKRRKAYGSILKHIPKRRRKRSLSHIKWQHNVAFPNTGYERDGQKYHDVTYLGEFEDEDLPHSNMDLLNAILKRKK